MTASLRLDIVPGAALDTRQRAALLRLCEEAYEEPFEQILADFESPTHVLGFLGDALVSHALWVPRTLHHGARALHVAYVEAVATQPALQGRGYASAVLRHLADQLAEYDMGALSPSDAAFYERLGWELWRGPLGLRTEGGTEPTPDEEVMILRLPRTPALDLDGPLAAEWRKGDIW